MVTNIDALALHQLGELAESGKTCITDIGTTNKHMNNLVKVTDCKSY